MGVLQDAIDPAIRHVRALVVEHVRMLVTMVASILVPERAKTPVETHVNQVVNAK